MSEQRETWLPWSDDHVQYVGTVSMYEDLCQCECDDINSDGRFGVTDYRPVRIPPPAEIEANARDAERWRMLMSGQADVRVIETEFLEEIDPTERIDHEIWINKQIKKGS